MGRLKELRKYVDGELNKMDDEDKRNSAIVHLYGVSLAATMIAKKHLSKAIKEKEQSRFDKLCAEFGM